MKKLLTKLFCAFKAEKGQGMVEYGLIIGLIAIALIGALLIFAPQIEGVFTRAGTELANAAAG
jgi:pilus assembly protein Flp/PilA